MLVPVVMLLALFTRPSPCSCTELDKGDLAKHFTALCTIINIASKTHVAPAEDSTAQQIEDIISAVNLTVSEGNLSADVIDQKDKSRDSLRPKSSAASATDDDTWDFWKQGAKKLKEEEEKQTFKPWSNAKGKHEAVAIMKQIAASALQLKKMRNKLSLAAKSAEISNKLKEALLGTGTLQTQTAWGTGGDTRAKLCCGNTAANTQLAGQSLKFDMLCLCSKGATAVSNGGKACCNGCETPNTALAAQTDMAATWANLKQKCSEKVATPPLSVQAIEAAIAAFMTLATAPPGTQKHSVHFFGKADGAFTDDCDGDKTATKGRGVLYKQSDFANGAAGPQWMQALRQAQVALNDMEHIRKQLHGIQTSAIALNSSLGSLLSELSRSQQTSVLPKKEEEAPVKDCNIHTTNATCTAESNCNWTSTDKSNGDFCRAANGEANTATTAGQGAAGTTASTRCARHGTDKTACENDKTSENKIVHLERGKTMKTSRKKRSSEAKVFM